MIDPFFQLALIYWPFFIIIFLSLNDALFKNLQPILTISHRMTPFLTTFSSNASPNGTLLWHFVKIIYFRKFAHICIFPHSWPPLFFFFFLSSHWTTPFFGEKTSHRKIPIVSSCCPIILELSPQGSGVVRPGSCRCREIQSPQDNSMVCTSAFVKVTLYSAYIYGKGTPGGPLVFQAWYHPCKRTFKTHPKHVFSGMKIDPKYVFLHVFFLICPSCPFQNLSIWQKTHPFFQFCTFLHP